VLTRLMGWKAAKLAGSTEVGAIWLRLHSSESQLEWDDMELALDCDAASENTEEVEEEAEEERGAAYG
jgi:hypothetical protein